MVVRSDWQRQASSHHNEGTLSITNTIWKWLKIGFLWIKFLKTIADFIRFQTVLVYAYVVSRNWAGSEWVFILFIYSIVCHPSCLKFIYFCVTAGCTFGNYLPFKLWHYSITNFVLTNWTLIHKIYWGTHLLQCITIQREEPFKFSEVYFWEDVGPHCIEQNGTRHF